MGVLRLPRLPTNMQIVDGQGRPIAAFTRFWNEAMQEIENAISGVDEAKAAADAATGAVAESDALKNLQISGVDATTVIISHDAGTSVTVSVISHTRYYGDGTSVHVVGGSVPGLAYNTTYFLYYDDPARAGGVVTYQVSTTNADASASDTHPDRHFVGAVAPLAPGQADQQGKPKFWGQ